MNKKYIYLIYLVLVIGLMACGSEADIIGYVLDKNDDSIFVVSKEAKDFSADDGIAEYYDAIWLSKAPADIEIGDLVQVWYDGPVQESYPLGGKVGKLEVVPPTTYDGAKLSEAEAINQAIQQQKPTEHIAVRSVTFDMELKMWKIDFKEIPDGDVYQVEFEE